MGVFLMGSEEIRRDAVDLLLPDFVRPLIGFDEKFHVLDEDRSIPDQVRAWEREALKRAGKEG